MTGVDAQTMPPVVRWIAAIFRWCAAAAYESVMPAANSVSAVPDPGKCSGVHFETAAFPQRWYVRAMPDGFRRVEFNGLVLKIEREMVAQAHIATLLAATTARIAVLKGDMETTRRRMQRSKRLAKQRRALLPIR